MILLRGLRPETDVPIAYTGPRPGEKMRELLTCPAYEELEETDHPRVQRVRWRNHVGTSLWAQVRRVVDLAEEGRDDEVQAALYALAVVEDACEALRMPPPTTRARSQKRQSARGESLWSTGVGWL